jgi:hypothetical protein
MIAMASKRMGRPPVTDHGTRAVYHKGCRCEMCCQAEAFYKRQRRLGKPALTALPDVDAIAEKAAENRPPEPGRVEAAVVAELGSLPAAAVRPGLAACCVALAHDIDDRGCAASHPGMVKQLAAVLEVLRAGAGGRGRLSAVRALSARETAG